MQQLRFETGKVSLKHNTSTYSLSPQSRDITAMLEFVSPSLFVQVAEEEGMEAAVCTRLVLLNNQDTTHAQHNNSL